MCAARTCEGETASGFHALGKGDQQTIAAKRVVRKAMAAGNFGPALRRNGLAAKLRNVHEIGQTSDATRNTRACARVMGSYW